MGNIDTYFGKSFTLGELQKDVQTRVENSVANLENANIWVKTKILEQVGKSQFALLNTMYKYFQGVDFDEAKYMRLAFCAFEKTKNAYLKFKELKDFTSDLKLIKSTFVKELGQDIIK